MLAVQAFGATPAPVASLVDSVGGAESLPEGHDENYYRLRFALRDGRIIVASTGLGVDGWELLGGDAIIDVDVVKGLIEFKSLHDDVVIRRIDLDTTAVA